MALTTRPARPLTDREIAKLLSSILGGLATHCAPENLSSAIRHIHENLETYEAFWEALSREVEPFPL